MRGASLALSKVCVGDSAGHSRSGLQGDSRSCFDPLAFGMVRTCCSLLGAWNLREWKEKGGLTERDEDWKKEEEKEKRAERRGRNGILVKTATGHQSSSLARLVASLPHFPS